MELADQQYALALTEQGFLINHVDWNETIAQALAEQAGLELQAAHWELIQFIRKYYFTYQHLPNTRIFTKAVAKQLGEEKGNSLYLQRLFPGSPLKLVCKIAGLPKPPNCL
ncbi:MAG: TusE/DsrC/DsvC family sulfur relay protein [Methylovulum sp.]|jgi:tRNA 2-thiouridine synthesizing protein E